jgi:hypothetical protein
MCVTYDGWRGTVHLCDNNALIARIPINIGPAHGANRLSRDSEHLAALTRFESIPTQPRKECHWARVQLEGSEQNYDIL